MPPSRLQSPLRVILAPAHLYRSAHCRNCHRVSCICGVGVAGCSPAACSESCCARWLWCVKSCAGIVVVGSQYELPFTR